MTNVDINPATVVGGNASSGTIIVSAAAPETTVVSLSSSNTAVANVPASVTVPAGGFTGTFTITTSAVAASTTVTITASYNGGSRTGTLTVTPAGAPPPAPTLQRLVVSPESVAGGSGSQGVVTLSGAAPAGGTTRVARQRQRAVAGVPASVTVAEGASNAVFAISTSAVAASTAVTISATSNGVTRTATLTVTTAAPPPQTATLTVTATGRSGERVTSSPAGISVATGTTRLGVVRRRDVDHAEGEQRPLGHLVGRLLERRQQGADLHLHALGVGRAHGQRAVGNADLRLGTRAPGARPEGRDVHTPRVSALLPTSALARLESDGYVVVEDVFEPESDFAPLMAEWDGVLTGVARSLMAEGVLHSLHEGLPFAERLIAISLESGRNIPQPFDISLPQRNITAETPMHLGDAIFGLITDDRLLDIVARVIGQEIISNPVQHIRMKLPQRALSSEGEASFLAGSVSWHQDLGVLTEEADTASILSVWVPITDATVENGCLKVIPGSHRRDLLDHCPTGHNLGIRTSS